MDKLGKTKVFVIPKKNSTLNGSQKWKKTVKEFVENGKRVVKESLDYLCENYDVVVADSFMST